MTWRRSLVRAPINQTKRTTVFLRIGVHRATGLPDLDVTLFDRRTVMLAVSVIHSDGGVANCTSVASALLMLLQCVNQAHCLCCMRLRCCVSTAAAHWVHSLCSFVPRLTPGRASAAHPHTIGRASALTRSRARLGGLLLSFCPHTLARSTHALSRAVGTLAHLARRLRRE